MTKILFDKFINHRLKKEEKLDCKGLIFRYKVNVYVNRRGDYVEQNTMSLLKRKSCKGCETCGWMRESLCECIGCELLPIIDDPEPDALYWLTTTNETRDYESGHIDGYDHEFIKIEEETDD